ncbi:MAG: InlB B-repeat-containing protein, partial [Paludibacteraceae bacterium]|nr:InlB B-repeat-containing protein [Paludibacteraceae bacterium]
MRNIVTKFIISLVCIFLTNNVLAKVSVPFTMSESLFNDGSVVVNSEGTAEWGHPEIDGAGLLGVCVGDFLGGFNWKDKYVDIAFDGVPDKLTFSGESAALTTDIEWYVKESSNGSSWSSKIWSADTRMVNDASIQLSPSTRYVRLCYSGNFRACFSNVTISSRYRLKVISNGETIRDEYLSAGTALSISTPTDIPSCKVFAGWDQNVPSTMPAEDLTLTAQFTSEQYTSTFQLSNAELGVTLSDFTQTFDCEASVSVESPSLKGYTFQGWSPSLPTVATAAMNGVTYVAQWIHNLYQYKVYTDDPNNPAISEQFHYEDAIAPLETPVRSGYDFQGWDAENPTTMPDHDVTIHALWEQKSYRFVVYYLDTDSSVTTLQYGDPITPPAEPFRVGFSFDGWDNEIPSFMPDHDVVIRANWSTSSYRLVVYQTETDSTVTNKEYGEELTPLEIPSRRGYVFVQWSIDLPATMPSSDLVVRAIWQKSTYTITLMSDEEVFCTKSFGYQDTVDMSGVSNPSKEGYKFIG